MYIIITNYKRRRERESRKERAGREEEGEGEGKRRRDEGEIQKLIGACVMVATLTLTWNVMAQKTNTVEDLAWSEMIENIP